MQECVQMKIRFFRFLIFLQIIQSIEACASLCVDRFNEPNVEEYILFDILDIYDDLLTAKRTFLNMLLPSLTDSFSSFYR